MARKSKMVLRTTLFLDQESVDAIRRIRNAKGGTNSSVIRRAVKEYAKRRSL